MRGIAAATLVVALTACGSAPPPKPAAAVLPADAAATGLTPAEQALRDRVQKLLAERMGAGARAIRVDVRGTSLWLTGVAPDRHERDRARAIAHEVPGVTRVDVAGLSVR